MGPMAFVEQTEEDCLELRARLSWSALKLYYKNYVYVQKYFGNGTIVREPKSNCTWEAKHHL